MIKHEISHESRKCSVLASAAHILKLELYREDYHGPCARMTRKFVKRSIFLNPLQIKIKKKKKKENVLSLIYSFIY